MANQVKLEIEKGVPIPPMAGYGYRATFRQMEVGDSIFLASDNHEKTRSSLTGCLSILKSELKFKFVTRRVDGGLRVWRTA